MTKPAPASHPAPVRAYMHAQGVGCMDMDKETEALARRAGGNRRRENRKQQWAPRMAPVACSSDGCPLRPRRQQSGACWGGEPLALGGCAAHGGVGAAVRQIRGRRTWHVHGWNGGHGDGGRERSHRRRRVHLPRRGHTRVWGHQRARDPRVTQHLVHGGSARGVRVEHGCQQAGGASDGGVVGAARAHHVHHATSGQVVEHGHQRWGGGRAVRVVAVAVALVLVLAVGGHGHLVRLAAGEHDEEADAQRPHVRGVGVAGHTRIDFRGHVGDLARPGQHRQLRVARRRWEAHALGKSKINVADHRVALVCEPERQVLQRHVAVGHLGPVQEGQTPRGLRGEGLHHLELHDEIVCLQEIKKIAVTGVLGDGIDARLILRDVEQSSHVRVASGARKLCPDRQLRVGVLVNDVLGQAAEATRHQRAVIRLEHERARRSALELNQLDAAVLGVAQTLEHTVAAAGAESDGWCGPRTALFDHGCRDTRKTRAQVRLGRPGRWHRLLEISTKLFHRFVQVGGG
mmetsp:Transcript_14880/g.47421  ORF Transcript_14880/g.47421 Transcript_14880/m.47421 type:complete len:517 (-) Transcript_14880:40-1590(-)